MLPLAEPAPHTPTEPVTEILHGTIISDPFRWLEDQDSALTRRWINEQTRYARSYLNGIPARSLVEQRIREFLDIETYDSLQKVGSRYFFRKRLREQEQPCIYLREGANGDDQLLVDPALRRTGCHTAVKPVSVSRSGRLLLYEIKQGGERSGTFEILDIETRRPLADMLPRGLLHGFAFSPDEKSFYYVHETLAAQTPSHASVYHHVIGTQMTEDREVFCIKEKNNVRLSLISDATRLGILVYRFHTQTLIDFYVKTFTRDANAEVVVADANYSFFPFFVPGRILALTNLDAPNRRIVEVRAPTGGQLNWLDIIPEVQSCINDCTVAGERIFVRYNQQTKTKVYVFDLSGHIQGEIPIREDETARLLPGSPYSDELFLEHESFTEPIGIFGYSIATGKYSLWARRNIRFEAANYDYLQVQYTSMDGTQIPMFLMGRRDVLGRSEVPTIMTSYGGFGACMTPQFSVFVAFLVERGCLFALPNIRGGSEFGVEWHNAAKRRRRQTAFDDFLSAAEWLVNTGKTTPQKLAMFGGSNSGLLVGAAMTQRPDLFRAVVCMVPLLDMLRYHLFDSADLWRDEFGSAEDPDDFAALVKYSPYHQVKEGVSYPATLIVSGDADKGCNPLHARKMTARLQAANVSQNPILLAYSEFRGHSPVLPLSERIEALTDRMAFLCDQLQLAV